MRAVLRSLYSPDVTESLDTFSPAISNDFEIFVEVEFGPDDNVGSEVFGLIICSPEALRRILDGPNKGFEFVRHRLVVEAWDISVIRRAIVDLGLRCEAETWSAVAERLSRHIAWEFEDYTPAP